MIFLQSRNVDLIHLNSSTHTALEVGVQAISPISAITNTNLVKSSADPPLVDSIHNLALPPCDIDVFDDNFQNWPTFRYLFSAVYVNNSRLSDMLQKSSRDSS